MGQVITRVNNWGSILSNKIKEAKTLKFSYGTHDCTCWSISVIQSYSNLEWTPKWTNKAEALDYQKNNNMQEVASGILGPPLNSIQFTQRGDLVQKDLGMRAALGICIGAKVVLLTKTGICYADLSDCAYSWRI